ncbi:MAG: alpha-glucosidase [Clostridia bacterium]|nr:alpha-glucosidase [Clostridia bacterium]
MARNWWKERVVYQIYPRSFCDSNGDGIGDIQGIIQKLDVLKELGIGILWLSPVYRSPNRDNGYDISDYCEINPEFGTMEDMDELIEKAKRLDIKLVMDLVINHTSFEHEWFQRSRKREEPYTDYYIWKDKPNNWTGFFGGTTWTYDEQRKQYYLHLFDEGQPDLNYNNPKVLQSVKAVMRFWLDKGVSGFRCDVINVLYKSSLKNGFPSPALCGREHYISKKGTLKILHELRRDVLSEYDCFTVGETVMVKPRQARKLCTDALDMVFAFEHMETDCFFIKWFLRKFKPERLFRALLKWQKKMPWNAVYFENHDQPRSVSRFGDDKNFHKESAKALAVLLLTLKGTPYVYQGEEIGMTNFDYESMDEIRDVESKNVYEIAKRFRFSEEYRWRMIRLKSRDNARTPMQWNAQENAGFSSGEPWLKVNKNHGSINFESEYNDPDSVWHFYKKLIEFRNGSEVLKRGSFRLSYLSPDVFAFERAYDGKKLGVIVNLSGKKKKVPCVGFTVLSTHGRAQIDCELEPYEAAILRR